MTPPFLDRRHAGRRLAAVLVDRWPDRPVVVLALPRGGVPVAAEVAAALGAPLDVLVVRKLGVPGQPELALGAIASGGVTVINDEVVRLLGITDAQIDSVRRVEVGELARRDREYRGERPPLDLAGRTVVLVDDGLATGATMRAAARAVRVAGAGHVVVAVPVAARESCRTVKEVADEVVCVEQPVDFRAVGLWYSDFTQTSDSEVRAVLSAASHARPRGSPLDQPEEPERG